ncbi:glycosyltransferase family 2 protein [Patescibacteria group bacterium]|nr:glycosyltransferase family 2 protein [Patescibacteria group bacterium]
MVSESIKYLHIGRAGDLTGKDKVLYRFFEILPGFFSVGTLIGIGFFSWFLPVWTAFFIIIFDLYWLIKTFYLSLHLRANWAKMRHYLKLDWQERLNNLKYDHIWQMVIMPFYKESYDVLFTTLESLGKTKWDKNKMIVVLAYEERAGEEAEKNAQRAQEEYQNKFGHFLIVKHPQDLKEEMPGKGSNLAYATPYAGEKILDANNIKYEDVLVSAFDIDTRPYEQYFLCLTWHFLTCEKPHRSSFQPVPIYNNNIWDAPAFSRVVATSGTFWQMMQQERPERLATFSSHSLSFKALHEIGYWQKNMVNEDSRIFWNAFMYYDGDYQAVPISYPISLDANLAPNFLGTVKNVYKQQNRWTYGTAENAVYILFHFLKNKKIDLKKKLRLLFVQWEGAWSLATNPLIIFFLGWLPLALGGQEFNSLLLSYNLPRVTRNIMTLAMFGLIMSAIISTTLLPPRPQEKSKLKYFTMIIQWVMIPFTIPIFGALPGLDAQIRLMLGKYISFWVTPKYRKKQEKSV